jgi:hypothetical protein
MSEDDPTLNVLPFVSVRVAWVASCAISTTGLSQVPIDLDDRIECREFNDVATIPQENGQ